jgi:rRNA maturation protein Nop10
MMDGFGIRYYCKGGRYEGNWQNDQREGGGREYNKEGTLRGGCWQCGGCKVVTMEERYSYYDFYGTKRIGTRSSWTDTCPICKGKGTLLYPKGRSTKIYKIDN